MGRAEDLFERLEKDGENEIDRLISNKVSEELFLDYKRSADSGAGTKLHADDRHNLARALSGFANSEGGIVLWGVDCVVDPATGADVPTAKAPISDPKRFVSWLEGEISACTIPPVANARHLSITQPAAPNGFVVTLVPKSDTAPHRCLIGKDKSKDRYLARAGSSFYAIGHDVLAGMFGRRPQPKLHVEWVPKPGQLQNQEGVTGVSLLLGVVVVNNGPGIARDVYVNLIVKELPNPRCRVSLSIEDQSGFSVNRGLAPKAETSISFDGFKLAPSGLVKPVSLLFHMAPPFQMPLAYELAVGHGTGPTERIAFERDAENLRQAFDAFIESKGQTPLDSGFLAPTSQSPR